MIRFLDFLAESDEHVVHAFHTTTKPLTKLHDDHPTWVSLHKHHADGWHRNTVENSGDAHTYKVEVRGKVAHHTDKHVQKLLKDHGVDHHEYAGHLVENPSKDEVHSHPATKALIKHGYHAYVHTDYDPNDFDNDADSMVVFHGGKHAKITGRHK